MKSQTVVLTITIALIYLLRSTEASGQLLAPRSSASTIDLNQALCPLSKLPQWSICTYFCVIAAQCSKQCSAAHPQVPSANGSTFPEGLYNCACQEDCTCAFAYCASCCEANGPGFRDLFCASASSENALWCEQHFNKTANPSCGVYDLPGVTYEALSPLPHSLTAFVGAIPAPSNVTIFGPTLLSSNVPCSSLHPPSGIFNSGSPITTIDSGALPPVTVPSYLQPISTASSSMNSTSKASASSINMPKRIGFLVLWTLISQIPVLYSHVFMLALEYV